MVGIKLIPENLKQLVHLIIKLNIININLINGVVLIYALHGEIMINKSNKFYSKQNLTQFYEINL